MKMYDNCFKEPDHKKE